MRIVGLIIGLGLFLAGFLLGGRAEHAFDLHSFYIVLGGGLAFTYFAHRDALWRAISIGFFGKTAEVETRSHSVEVLKTLRSAVRSMGIATALVGAISMSRGLENLADFGPAFSVLLLAPFYGVVFGELLVMTAMRRIEVDGGD